MDITRIVELCYRVTPSGDGWTDDVQPLEVTNNLGKFQFSEGLLSVKLVDEFKTFGAACETIQPFLEAWQIETAIREFERLCFKLTDAKYVGATPSDFAKMITGRTSEPHQKKVPGEYTLLIQRNCIPDPPTITVTPELKEMYKRYERSSALTTFGKAEIGMGEPFPAMAYYCLTVIEQAAGGRNEAATRFNVDVAILRKIGELTSTRPHQSGSRKSMPQKAKPLSRQEEEWIKFALRLLFLQYGQKMAGRIPERVSMDDLPSLG